MTPRSGTSGRITARCVRPDELTAGELERWRAWASARDGRDSPFLHPEYAALLARHRDQVRVVVAVREGRPIGFLPLEVHARGVARPLGVRLADVQGMVGPDDELPDVTTILRASRLRRLHFDHWLVPAGALPRQATSLGTSPAIDLAGGFDAYVAERRAAGSQLIPQVRRKRRKLVREHGEVEFRWNDPDPEAFARLVRWKGAQRRRTGTFDVLQVPWVRAFLESLPRADGGGLTCVLSTLRVAGEIAAVHLGMHTRTALHYWFPSFDPAWERSSPGLILLLHLVEEAAERNLARVDLGKGDERYKSSFASATLSIASGTCDVNPARQRAWDVWHRVRKGLGRSALRPSLEAPKRLFVSKRLRSELGSE